MANIDNLNFKVIIDDKDFNKKIKDLEKDARKFNTNMSSLLHVKKASAQISQKEVENNRRALQAKVDEHKAQEKINREKMKTEALQKKINKQMEGGAKSAKGMSASIGSAVGPLMQLVAIGGVTSLIKQMVQITGEFELQKRTLGAMLNDLGAAEHILEKLKALSVESPFTYKELSSYAKQLTAFSIPKEELFETTSMIADLSAGLGVAADRLILAYGQVKSAAFLRGQEVRQFTEAGIPLLKELAEEFEKLEGRAVSVGEVFDRISTRQVSFEMVAKVLRDMTTEGGKFYQMQQIQASTLWGRLQTLKGQWQIALDEMGKKNSSTIHGVIDWMTKLVKNWEKVAKILRTVIIAFGTYKAALLLAALAQKTVVAVNMAANFIKTAKAVGMTAAAVKSFTLSLASILPIVALIGGAIYGMVTSADDATESTHDLNKEIKGMYQDAKVLATALDRDLVALDNLTKGTQNYRDAIRQINEKYGEFLPNLIQEKDAYEDIAAAAEQAKRSIIEKSRQEAIRLKEEDIEYQMSDVKDAGDQLLKILNSEFSGYGESLGDFLEKFEYNILNTHNFDAARDAARVWEKTSKDYFGRVLDVQMRSHDTDIDFQTALVNYAHYLDRRTELTKKAYDDINNIYNEGDWDSFNEYAIHQNADHLYNEGIEALRKRNVSEREFAEESIEIEEKRLQYLADKYRLIGNEARARDYEKQLEELENFWKSWRGKVQDLLLDRGYSDSRSFGLWPTEYTSSTDFIDKILKDYKEVSENLEKLHFDPSTEKGLTDQKKIIEAIADLLNIDLSTGKRSGLGKSSIERQIDALSGLKKAYDELKAMNLSDATIVQMLKENFPDVVKTYGDGFIESLDYSNRILKFAQELKKTERDKAINILKTLGLDNLSNDKKEIKDAIDAAKKYFEAIRKWQTSDFNLDGSGIAFEIGKVANELQNKFNDIDLHAQKTFETLNQIDLSDAKAVEAVKNTFEKEFGEGSWDTFYEEFVKEGEDAIKLFAEKQARYERKIAQEKLNNLASRYVKDSLEGVDMSHWGDKSIRQIEAIRQRLAELMSSGIELPDSTLEKLNELGLSTDDLVSKIKELFGEKFDLATVEKFKALAKVVNQAADAAKDLGKDLEKLGETLDNDVLKRIGSSLQTFEELAKILTECDSLMQAFGKSSKSSTEDAAEGMEETAEGAEKAANSSDLITLAFKLAAMAISKVVNGINESQKALIEAREAAIEFEHALKQIEYNDIMESHDTIFGTDEYRQYQEAMAKAAEYQKSALDAAKEIQTTYEDINKALNMSSWALFSKGARETADLVRSLGLGDILVDARTGWQKFWGTGNELVSSVNINDFMDEEGMLKGEELREWLKKNGEAISQDNKEALERMLNDYDLYVQAVEDASAYLSNIFGNVADDMADKFIEAFKASGEAALDYADIMDGVATEIARSFIKSMLIDNIFTPEKVKEVTDLFLGGDRAGALSVVDEAMKAAQALTPEIQALLEELKPYFNMDEEAESNLGNGIKGITEDTANLLASYLNAIRADVSYSKTLWERMDARTQQIATMLAGFSAPTLMDYQKRIEANTADIAFNTQRILSELQSVMTSEGGYTAIRTYS